VPNDPLQQTSIVTAPAAASPSLVKLTAVLQVMLLHRQLLRRLQQLLALTQAVAP
jgi:hypothetical protein